MSGVFAILGVPAAVEEAASRRLLQVSRRRGPDLNAIWRDDDGVIGVCRAEWEMAGDFAEGVLLLEAKDLVVAADATLYYRDDLRRKLRGAGVDPEGDSPSHLIAAAYRAWGADLVKALEGDFGFLVWDRRRRTLVAACDLAGTRPLFFATVGDRLILGSSMTAVAAHPAVPRDLNALTIAEDLINAGSTMVRETTFRAVERLPAGTRLVWQPGSGATVERFWEVPEFDQDDGTDFQEAAEQLRETLGAAVRERLARHSPTAVWTSGGYDSPAVYALAHRAAGTHPVIPVSMSYPVGDSGREDELVEAVAKHLGVSIQWVRIGDVPSWRDGETWAGLRDQPFAHPYEQWSGALAGASRAAGARVALGGNGGDQFFSVSPVFLADLTRAGKLGELAREARALGLRPSAAKEFFHWAVQPALPASVLELARRLRGGRPLKPHLVTAVPDWMGMDASVQDAVWRRQWQYGLRRPNESFGSAEASWFLKTVFTTRVCASIVEIGLNAQLEARSPMFDRRVIEFMARRPRRDRFALCEGKRLLRQAMSGLLPDSHLAPRPRRTGLPKSYLSQVRRAAFPGWAETIGPDLRLAQLELVQSGRFHQSLSRYLGNPRWEGSLGSELFNVFSAEFWLRSHTDAGANPMERVA